MRTTRTAYPSDLTDDQWALIAPLIPGSTGWGAPITVARREVVNAILYLLANGCKWSALPHDFPREGTVRDYYHQWRRAGVWQRMPDALRDELRHRAGRDAEPSAAIVDSQTVKATRTTGTRGYDAGKKN
jgi:putative transposase